MKKSLARKITLSILAGAVLMSSSVVWAADDISVNGKVYWTYDSSVSGYLRNVDNNPDGTVPDGTYYGIFYGARASTAVTNGKVNIEFGAFDSSIYGGYSDDGSVSNNTVTIKGGTFNGNISGGYSVNSYASSNTLVINGGTFKPSSEYGTSLIAGRAYNGSGNAYNNKLVITDLNTQSGEVTVGNVTKILEGFQSVAGGMSYGGEANENEVEISGGKIAIIGGAKGIFGGYGGSAAKDNKVTISGCANIEEADLFGGAVTSTTGGIVTGNIFNIGTEDTPWQATNTGKSDGTPVQNKVRSIQGFDKINFNYINWSDGGTVIETKTLALNNTQVDKVVIGGGTVKNSEYMNLISATASTNPISGTYNEQQDKEITIRTGLTTSKIVKGDIVLDGNNIKLTIDDTSIASDGIVAKVTDSSTEPPVTPPGTEPGTEPPVTPPPSSGGTEPGTGISGGTNIPTGADLLLAAIEARGSSNPAYDALYAAYNNTTEEKQKEAATNMLQLGEAGGQSATAANISRNVSSATVNRMSFGGRGGHHHRGGHGPADFNEKDGSAVWAQYVHGKDKVDGMALADGVTTSYESQFNGVVLGVDFKEVGKYQSGIAFNYGEGDSHTKNIALSRSDYDFWGIGYYGAVKNADSNVIFDINYAKSDSEVKQFNSGVELEAEPETTTISAGVKVEKLIDKGAMQFVPYAGLRFMSVDTDEYSANYLGKEAFNYSADRQNIWLLPVGVSFRQENVYDSGWVVTPKVDLSYIWAFGDTENEMTVRTPDVAEAARLGYTVMNDGSFLGSIGLEAEKGDWTFGVAYSYQKSSDSRSDRWYVDAKYSF
ncbi:MAG: autotransporter outer membrane beta-barrel domain-containing protein [Phascolarctobacterium sp.]|nr:autotransporter outer membrane beta-barrel domain-containing protein [Phascolarctobacterium sp.]